MNGTFIINRTASPHNNRWKLAKTCPPVFIFLTVYWLVLKYMQRQEEKKEISQAKPAAKPTPKPAVKTPISTHQTANQRRKRAEAL